MKNIEKVSLILTTFNSKHFLPLTLESIIMQDYKNIEVVIKDGASNDGTLDIIREYQERGKLDIVYETSKDLGIYDAMNKGFLMSTGSVVAFFNDLFTECSAISKLVSAMNSGAYKYIGAHSDLIYCQNDLPVRYWKMGNSGSIKKGWMPAHPTLFLRREIYEDYGLYKTNFKCSADYEFMIRVLKEEKNRLAYVPEVLVEMFYGGTSNQGIKNYMISLKEGHEALKENNIPNALLIDLRRTFRVFRQFREAKEVRTRGLSEKV